MVEKLNEIIPEGAKGLTLILSVIIVTQIAFTPSPTITPTSTLTNTPTSTLTNTPTSTLTNTPTPTPQVTACVITYGLNVRTTPGVTEDTSNHARIWLRNKAGMTILKPETDTPEWA